MAKNEKTSKRIGTLASKGLRKPGSLTKRQIQSVSAAALTQRPDRKKAKSSKSKAR